MSEVEQKTTKKTTAKKSAAPKKTTSKKAATTKKSTPKNTTKKSASVEKVEVKVTEPEKVTEVKEVKETTKVAEESSSTQPKRVKASSSNKKLIIIIASALLAVLSVGIILLVCLKPKHDHTYEAAWSYDSYNHWHKATCEHTNETSAIAAHSYDDDYICNVCGFNAGIMPDKEYSLSENGEYYTLTGINGSILKSVTIPSSFNGKPVKEISAGAFTNNSVLETLTIGSNITNINANTFVNCSALKTINFSEGLQTIGNNAFSGCSSLEKVVLPESVTTIGNEAFKNCSSLLEFEAKGDLTGNIGASAFAGCNKLENIRLNSVNEISKNAFSSLPNLKTLIVTSVKTINENAFDSTGIISANIGNVETINKGAFQNNTNLTTIAITCAGTNLTLGTNIFSNCSKLAVVTINSSVYQLPENTFSGCTLLNKVTINGSLTKLSSNAFNNCTTAFDLIVTGKIEEIYANAFDSSHTTTNLKKLSASSIDKVGANAFNGNTSVVDIFVGVIPYTFGNIDEIGNMAFANMTKLSSLRIGNVNKAGENIILNSGESLEYLKIGKITQGALTIADNQFKNSALKEVDIDSVSSIGNYAFQGNSDLVTVIIGNIGSLGHHAFANNPNLASLLLGDVNHIVVPTAEEIVANGWQANKKYTYLFSNCPSLAFIRVGDALDWEIDSNEFKESTLKVTSLILGRVKSIGHHAFYGCQTLSYLSIGKSGSQYYDANYEPIVIAEDAFHSCSNLSNVVMTLPKVNISDYSFYNCSNLAQLTINAQKINIGSQAFVNCNSLQKVVLTETYNEEVETASSIGVQAFNGCEALTSVAINVRNINIGNYAFLNCSNLKTATIGSPISELTQTEIVNTIGTQAFGGCEKLVNITIDMQNVKILTNAFTNTFKVKEDSDDPSLIINADVKEIGASAFSGTIHLLTLVINGSVENFEDGPVVSDDNPQKIDINAFNNSSIKTIIINGNLEYLCKSFTKVYEVDEVIVSYIETIKIDGLVYCIQNNVFANSKVKEIALSIPADKYDAKGLVVGENKITANTFAGSVLENIYITGAVSIEEDAFTSLTTLTQVLVPSNIDNYDFVLNTSASILFNGTEVTFREIFNLPIETLPENLYFYTIAPLQVGNYWHYSQSGEPTLNPAS